MKARLYKKILNTTYDKVQDQLLKDRLIKDARHEDPTLHFYRDSKYGNSSYVGGAQVVRRIRKALLKRKDGKAINDSILAQLSDSLGSNKVARLAGKNAVILGGKDGKGLSSAAVLAHELGHKHYMRDKDANIIAKSAHKLTPITEIPITKVGMMPVNIVNAFHSGYKTEMNKYKGKKTGLITKVKGLALPIAMASPTLVSEAAASIHGYGQLKKHGASKDYLKTARNQLGNAYGTYLISKLPSVLVALASQYLGKSVAKEVIIQKLKQKDPTKTRKELVEIYKQAKLVNKAKQKSIKNKRNSK